MKRRFLIPVMAAGLWICQPVLAGTISGIVRAVGKQGAEADAGGGAYSSKALKNAERIDYDAMKDFVVFIKGPVPGAKLARPLEKITQKNAVFDPHVLPIMIGTTVEFPNEDNTFHNVFSKSDAAQFDMGLNKKGDKAHSFTFTNLGEVDVFCSIHSRMNCIILVKENPYFAVSGAGGHYAITNVPPGKYTLVAWQERFPQVTSEITVPEDGSLTGVNFKLGPDTLPKY